MEKYSFLFWLSPSTSANEIHIFFRSQKYIFSRYDDKPVVL